MSGLLKMISREPKCKRRKDKVHARKAYVHGLCLCRRERDALSTFVTDNHKLHLLNAWLPWEYRIKTGMCVPLGNFQSIWDSK